jgi:stage IV sporulation protein FB
MGQKGYFTLGHWRGIPIRMHWTTPIGALLFTRFEFVPVIWLGFVVIVFVHEFGHALMVRWCGAAVLSIDMDALGGSCSWEGEVSPLQRAFIAWGGVLAQLVLFGAVKIVDATAGWPPTLGGVQLLSMLTSTNLRIAVFNLIPVPPLDGWQAWQLVPLVYRALRSRPSTARRRPSLRLTRQQLSRFEDVEDSGQPNREVDEFVKKTLKRLSDPASLHERDPEEK